MKAYPIPKGLAEQIKGISIFKLIFADIIGQMKEMQITSEELADILNDGQGFDGSSIRGFARIEESDLMVHPRLKSFRRLPPELSSNGKPLGLFFCEVRTPEGKYFPGDPRHCLKKMLRKAQRLGYTFYVGPELEFFYFRNSTSTEGLDRLGYFDAATKGEGSALIEKTVEILRTIGIQVECSHHEVAPSQYEIDMKYQNALTMADQVLLFKWIVKQVAESHGLFATFLPKPIFGENGSGMHTHMSLFRDDKNAFFDRRHRLNLSATARQFTAGLLLHVPEFTVITNPIVNSYKRIVPGYEAPCYVSWGQRNRSSLVRVPRYRTGKEQATRVELRSPDPTCNPYLAFTVMLAAGLDGIENGLRLPPAIEKNIFSMPESERHKLKIAMLPGSLQEAIDMAENSTWLKRVIGSHIHTAFLDNKRIEADDYRTHISPWEIEHLMPRY